MTDNNNNNGKFKAGTLVLLSLFALTALYGLAMVILILIGEGDAIALRLINGFLAMFSGLVGLASGYILGGRNGRKE